MALDLATLSIVLFFYQFNPGNRYAIHISHYT